jgi:hypothetical protein
MMPINQNLEGMAAVWAVVVFGPVKPFYAYVIAGSREEAIQETKNQYPTQIVSEWAERDSEIEQESKFLVEEALEQACHDASVAVAKRKNGNL